MKDKASKRISSSRLRGRTPKKPPKGFLRCSFIGAVVGSASLIILAFLLSYLLYMTDDPGRYVTPTAFFALYISAFIGGSFATKLNRTSPLLCGASVGLILTALTFLLSLPVKYTLSSGYSVAGALGLRSAIIVCSIIGAYIGTMKKENNKKRNYKYKKR